MYEGFVIGLEWLPWEWSNSFRRRDARFISKKQAIFKRIPVPHNNRIISGAKLWPNYMSNVPYRSPNG